MDVSGQRVLVVGVGRSGLAAARLLQEKGAHVLLNDAKDAAALGDRYPLALDTGAELHLGGHDPSVFASVDRIVVSPGVPKLAALDAADRAGVPIHSEVEVASWYLQGTLIGVTGTNGKSTVTSLLGEISRACGWPTFVGGNLGTPLVEAVGSEAAGPDGVVVVELSSFQLERVDTFRADVAVLLNVTPDHLDRYDSFDHYADTKGRVFGGQGPDDVAVVPYGDVLCQRFAEAAGGRVVAFGGDEGTVRVVDDEIRNGSSAFAFPLSGLRIRGAHNYDNACAAVAAARAAGAPVGAIRAALGSFSGLPHRAEWVRERGGVTYYDDSKATNVGAAVAAIEGLRGNHERLVVIAGGRDKGGSYAPLRRAMESAGRALILLGESSPLIEAGFDGSSVPLVHAESMADAVAKCAAVAQDGDGVVLAPACSSFDLYASYAHRGDDYQAEVHRLVENGA